MKKIYVLSAIILLALSINSNAQLNYLFSATSRPYVPVTGGTTPHLISYQTNYELSDEGIATIPIGFTFNYNGENHKEVNVSINGFITLGTPFSINYNLFRNFLANGPFLNLYPRPVIAAFWDDLYLVDTANLVYKTTGHAPFRVFTIEWKKARWSYDAPAPVLSVELKLYETTNVIEFHYKDEGGIPFKQFAYASIGITSADYHRDFISLQNTSQHPTISLVKAMDSLTEKPANNQVYRFIPALLKAPENIRRLYSYTDKSVSFKLQSGGFNAYEYAVTQSPVAPSSGTPTVQPNVTVSSLSPATTYYLYERSRLFGFLYSQWACDSFTTSIAPASLPYVLQVDPSESFIGIPEGTRTQDFRDTSIYYSVDQFTWLAGTDFPNPGDNLVYYQRLQGYIDDDTWLFTRGLHLTGGKTYRLSFSYLAYANSNPGEIGSLEIKYGTGAGFKGMNSGVLFKKSDINSNDPQADTTIAFTPNHTNVYYFGIHDFTPANEGLPLVVNFTVDEKADLPITLNGTTNNTDNFLAWAINEPNNVSNIRVQRSSDGIAFENIDVATPGIVSKNKTGNDHPMFKIPRKTDIQMFSRGDEGNSKTISENDMAMSPLHQQIQTSLALTNSTQTGLTESRTTGLDARSKHKYIDHSAKGLIYYRLQYADKNGKINYSNIVALKNSALLSSLTIYPNPVKELLNIKIVSKGNSHGALQVTDLTGKMLQSSTTRINIGQTIISLDVADLPAGIYLLKILSEDGQAIEVRKFIKH